MVREEPRQTQQDSKQANPSENSQSLETLFSPRFKSVAAMAGWDEEALIVASLVVEDTPDRQSKHKKRSDLIFKTPPSTNSRRKRRAQRSSPVSTPIAPLNLEEEETPKKESENESKEQRIDVKEEKKIEPNEPNEQKPAVSCSNPAPALHCMDKLREELSCAICLEICFEPSTTPCGHSFCKKCLRSAADKCGKRCPKCRQLISNGRSCTVNTVLWNTIQLLFPQEVEARKASGALNNREVERQSPESGSRSSRRTRSIRPPMASSSDATVRRRAVISQNEDLSRLVSADASTRRRRGAPNQDEDAALALRLQREEFLESFRGGTHQQSRTTTPLSLARENLRAMASRAINIRMRSRPV
ncbi:Zinc finger, RING-type [Corchorus olitorius]|uniref:RING-type E3 ubiquitin transferase n=1 Tax=Corchorus olitorius TaxID=93759 RepID=A0A1R3HFE3_9ROSI|nr:Zinc finger, RING-type [Corchorus olitorius]